MQFLFHKYQGTGNDFIIIDDRQEIFPVGDAALVKAMCDRRFGIGADGLMLLRNLAEFDFNMVYFNSDGNPSSMCGNGGRCLSAFAKSLGIVKNEANFLAVDGPHFVRFDGKIVSLQMQDVLTFHKHSNDYILNTGSPHYVQFVENCKQVDVFSKGRAIRNSETFIKEGINVNFVEILPKGIFVRTYERGVEDETLSCGTGVTASAMAYFLNTNPKSSQQGISVQVETLGGKLSVQFDYSHPHSFKNVFLNGPANFVFEGIYSL